MAIKNLITDCGIPSNEALSMEKVKEWDGIGITRGMHITCSSGYDQQGSELFLCRADGFWKTNLNCTFKGEIDKFNKRNHKLKSKK